jgi:hypothetical protein
MPRAPARNFATEADLCAAFVTDIQKVKGWKIYPETAGFDLLLVREEDGAQLAIEAKLALNTKVLEQALEGLRWSGSNRQARGG